MIKQLIPSLSNLVLSLKLDKCSLDFTHNTIFAASASTRALSDFATLENSKAKNYPQKPSFCDQLQICFPLIGGYHAITVENENGQNFQFGGLPQSHWQRMFRHAL